MNLSQQKREKMLAFLAELKAAHNDDVHLQAFNEIENALVSKKYGLVWEEHSENVEEMLKKHIPVLTELKDRQIIAGEQRANSERTASEQRANSERTASEQRANSR
ncbi:methyltransferase [Pasteurella oralis]|uniref:methyltransferase n=1 Tax=Pasteurella oralis TaxID=1071947 RepID=UPI001FE69483|nr:methyltransferase [Pasteurella oralis]